jgi:hypothetical protein
MLRFYFYFWAWNLQNIQRIIGSLEMLNLAMLLPYQKNYEQGALVGEGGIPGLYSVADMFCGCHKIAYTRVQK